MRHKYNTIVILTAILFSLLWACCGNEPDGPETTIEGTWNWVCTCGGFAGMKYYQDNFKVKYTLIFERSKFRLYKDRKIIKSGHFSLKMVSSQPFGDSSLLFIPDFDYVDHASTQAVPSIVLEYGIYIKYNDTTLRTTESCVDCFSSTFRRR